MENVRIAMWSGPRNISTAMMRSFGARSDAFVTDEPLYAHYLKITGYDHPGADEIIQHHDDDPQSVVRWLTGSIPQGKTLWYQKHMTHHILPGMDTSWFGLLKHAFLIRRPADMLTSLIQVIDDPTAEQTGLPGQVDIYQKVCEATGTTPPVVDSRDIRLDPQGVLSQLCAQLDIPWDPAMLQWEPGPRDTDGIWAKHWYANVEQTTGFAPWQPKQAIVPETLRPVLDECNALYQLLAQHRITTDITEAATD